MNRIVHVLCPLKLWGAVIDMLVVRWLTLMTAPFKTDERFSNFDFTNDILMYVLAYWVLNYFADA